jgi:molybdopterin-guanine dinucleotide biosynthesis protein A
LTTPVVILAGGQGRRIGGRKPERLLGGRPLISHVLDRARAWGGPVAVACRRLEQWPFEQTGEARLYDDPDLDGPLGGLAAALEWALGMGCDKVMVAACDTPFLPLDVVQRLEGALRPDNGAALAATPDRRQPACALWRVESRAGVRAEALEGWRSLRGVAARVGAAIVEWPADRAEAFININTPEDLVLAGERLATYSTCGFAEKQNDEGGEAP